MSLMTPVCAPTLEKPSLWHVFTCLLIPSLCPESLTRSLSKLFSPIFLMRPIKCFLPSITFLCASHFFFVCFFYFHRTLFVGLWELVWTSEVFQIFLLCIHFFVKQLTHFLIDFSQTCVSTSSMYALPVMLFSAWSKHLNVFEKGHYTVD